MPATKLKEYLDSRGVEYVTILHPPAYTAPEAAASSHVTGRGFAKTVIVHMNDKLAMVVVPANRKIVLSDLREMLDTHDVRLATEDEFKDRFPDCEIGAMPPFGNLYGLPVYISHELANEPQITFNACTHNESIKMSFADFANLTKPVILDFITS
ncbi:deacylase [Opitutaceae bacterium EW11]|nr:deacylase [Opitutaceae bacterium EW11]